MSLIDKAKEKLKKVNKDEAAKQHRIQIQWREFAKTEAYDDLMKYGDGQMGMLLKYAEERAVPSPTGKGFAPIDSETAGALLQNRRGVNILMTYIRLRSE